MRKKDRCVYIEATLAKLFPSTPIPLDHRDPYTLLVAVLLSARCTDKRVNETTPILFKRAQTPGEMAALEHKEIEDIIRPCGLAPRKAKAIVDLSRLIVKNHSGRVPEDMETLEALPGIGHKSASVVLAQAFGQQTFPVDTHIHRLAQQWNLTDGKSVAQTERDMKAAFRPSSWNKLHLRMIFYGRTHCKAPGCDGRRCLICRHCFPGRSRPTSYRRS